MTEDEWNLLVKELITQGKITSEQDLKDKLIRGEEITFKVDIESTKTWRGMYGSCS